MELNEYISKWSEKLSISEGDIKKEYDKLVEEEGTIHPALGEEDRKTRALQRLAMVYKKQLRSPAIGFEGMIIGIGDTVDTVARIRAEAIKMFRENPEMAISQGITDSDGYPLDTRKEWSAGRPNKGYAKPLPEHSFLRTIFGVALKKNIENSVRFFTLNLSGEIAKDDTIPIFKPITFRAIDRTPPELKDTQYKLNSSMFTDFTIDESLKVPPLDVLINNYCGSMKINISDLDGYHDENADDYNRLAIVEGDVTTLVLEPTSVGSKRLVLDSEQEKFDLESPGTTCWVPERINIDFAEQSKIVVIGRTTRGKKLDDQGVPTEEPGDVMINVFGLYPLPDYKIQPNVKELTEENTKVEEEEPTGEDEFHGKDPADPTDNPPKEETPSGGDW